MLDAIRDLITLDDPAVSLSPRKQALLRAVLVEVEHNRALIEACRFEESDVHRSALALRLVAKRLHTRSMELFIAEEGRSARLFADIERQLANPSLPEADDAAMAEGLYVAQQIVWLYRKIVVTRALAATHEGNGDDPVDVAMDVRFHIRLRNIMDACLQLSAAIEQIQSLPILETAVTNFVLVWGEVVRNWEFAQRLFRALQSAVSAAWAELKEPSAIPRGKQIPSRSTAR